jgi:hypothetical protein
MALDRDAAVDRGCRTPRRVAVLLARATARCGRYATSAPVLVHHGIGVLFQVGGVLLNSYAHAASWHTIPALLYMDSIII